MAQKNPDHAGIFYETHEGMADFHAAGRRSHITEDRNWDASRIVSAPSFRYHFELFLEQRESHLAGLLITS